MNNSFSPSGANGDSHTSNSAQQQARGSDDGIGSSRSAALLNCDGGTPPPPPSAAGSSSSNYFSGPPPHRRRIAPPHSNSSNSANSSAQRCLAAAAAAAGSPSSSSNVAAPYPSVSSTVATSSLSFAVDQRPYMGIGVGRTQHDHHTHTARGGGVAVTGGGRGGSCSTHCDARANTASPSPPPTALSSPFLSSRGAPPPPPPPAYHSPPPAYSSSSPYYSSAPCYSPHANDTSEAYTNARGARGGSASTPPPPAVFQTEPYAHSFCPANQRQYTVVTNNSSGAMDSTRGRIATAASASASAAPILMAPYFGGRSNASSAPLSRSGSAHSAASSADRYVMRSPSANSAAPPPPPQAYGHSSNTLLRSVMNGGSRAASGGGAGTCPCPCSPSPRASGGVGSASAGVGALNGGAATPIRAPSPTAAWVVGGGVVSSGPVSRALSPLPSPATPHVGASHVYPYPSPPPPQPPLSAASGGSSRSSTPLPLPSPPPPPQPAAAINPNPIAASRVSHATLFQGPPPPPPSSTGGALTAAAATTSAPSSLPAAPSAFALSAPAPPSTTAAVGSRVGAPAVGSRGCPFSRSVPTTAAVPRCPMMASSAMTMSSSSDDHHHAPHALGAHRAHECPFMAALSAQAAVSAYTRYTASVTEETLPTERKCPFFASISPPTLTTSSTAAAAAHSDGTHHGGHEHVTSASAAHGGADGNSRGLHSSLADPSSSSSSSSSSFSIDRIANVHGFSVEQFEEMRTLAADRDGFNLTERMMRVGGACPFSGAFLPIHNTPPPPPPHGTAAASSPLVVAGAPASRRAHYAFNPNDNDGDGDADGDELGAITSGGGGAATCPFAPLDAAAAPPPHRRAKGEVGSPPLPSSHDGALEEEAGEEDGAVRGRCCCGPIVDGKATRCANPMCRCEADSTSLPSLSAPTEAATRGDNDDDGGDVAVFNIESTDDAFYRDPLLCADVYAASMAAYERRLEGRELLGRRLVATSSMSSTTAGDSTSSAGASGMGAASATVAASSDGDGRRRRRPQRANRHTTTSGGGGRHALVEWEDITATAAADPKMAAAQQQEEGQAAGRPPPPLMPGPRFGHIAYVVGDGCVAGANAVRGGGSKASSPPPHLAHPLMLMFGGRGEVHREGDTWAFSMLPEGEENQDTQAKASPSSTSSQPHRLDPWVASEWGDAVYEGAPPPPRCSGRWHLLSRGVPEEYGDYPSTSRTGRAPQEAAQSAVARGDPFGHRRDVPVAPLPRCGHAAVATPQGTVIMFGGSTADTHCANDCWELSVAMRPVPSSSQSSSAASAPSASARPGGGAQHHPFEYTHQWVLRGNQRLHDDAMARQKAEAEAQYLAFQREYLALYYSCHKHLHLQEEHALLRAREAGVAESAAPPAAIPPHAAVPPLTAAMKQWAARQRCLAANGGGEYPMGRKGHTLTMVGKQHVVLIGGCNPTLDPRQYSQQAMAVVNSDFTRVAWMFNVETGKWRSFVPLGVAPRGRTYHVAAGSCARRSIFVFGGASVVNESITAQDNGTFFNDLHELTFRCDGALVDRGPPIWRPIETTCGPRPSPRMCATAVIKGHKLLILFGGGAVLPQHDSHVDGQYELDTQSMAWRRLGFLRAHPSCSRPTTCLLGNRLVNFGGTLWNSDFTNAVRTLTLEPLSLTDACREWLRVKESTVCLADGSVPSHIRSLLSPSGGAAVRLAWQDDVDASPMASTDDEGDHAAPAVGEEDDGDGEDDEDDASATLSNSTPEASVEIDGGSTLEGNVSTADEEDSANE